MQTKKEGNIFIIPLFLPSEFKDNIKSYRNYKFNKSDIYAFGRLIEEDKSSGDIIEVFRYIGSIPNSEEIIITSGRLFEPIHVCLAFTKYRWQFVFENKAYDKNVDSDYQNITFQFGTSNDVKLWKGGVTVDIERKDIHKYNEWVIYYPTQVEKRIKEAQI